MKYSVEFDKNIDKNENTGLVYELALFLKILKIMKFKSTEFISVISKRSDYNKIVTLCNKISGDVLMGILLNYDITHIYKVELTTQNDNVGPSDIVINDIFGLSIKYNTKCNFNPTGRNFLKESDIIEYKESLPKFFLDYNKEKNPLRSRKTKSESLNIIINKLKEKVVNNWNDNILTESEKIDIAAKLYHMNSPINYIIIRINNKGVLFVDETTFNFDIKNIKLSNLNNSHYILFYCNEKMIGKMQVKFNNGVLERYKGKGTPDFIIDGIEVKKGNVITSWNFSIS